MVERHRPGHTTPQAAVALDEKGQALERLLPEVLARFNPELGAAVDLVTATVSPADIADACLTLRDSPELQMDYLMCLCVVDYEEHLQVVYHLYSTSMKHMMVLKTNVSPDDPVVPTVTSVWLGADWYERESHDLFGVTFEGHHNLAPLLLYEGFEGYPGRRNFEMPEYTEW